MPNPIKSHADPQNRTVHVVMPLQGRPEMFAKFMDREYQNSPFTLPIDCHLLLPCQFMREPFFVHVISSSYSSSSSASISNTV